MKELTAREAIAASREKRLDELLMKDQGMQTTFNLDISLWCEGNGKHAGPREMKETSEKESGVKYFKCIEEDCGNEISIMLQSVI